jgi:hypothetical protein
MKRLVGTVLALLVGTCAFVRDARSDTQDAARRIAEFVIGHDYSAARKALAAVGDMHPRLALERARLQMYEQDCDGAVDVLTRPDVAPLEESLALVDIARGCARVVAQTVVETDEANGVEIRYQDEFDRSLTPVIVETVVKAREALTRDLQVSWPKPTRITVVRDLLSLAAMTGLPYESAKTTGTVAVAKWGRVTLLSPRASHHGYAWRDTVAHELTHLAVTRATLDLAPLWLQEGLAKRGETRWREAGLFDDKPPADAIIAKGAALKLDIPLDKLGPSIAMLPSADAAMVAFAEVTSFVRFLAGQTADTGGITKLLAELRSKKSVGEALVSATGADLATWENRWRATLGSKPSAGLSALFGLGPPPPDAKETRDRSRLAELFLRRGKPKAAQYELSKLKKGSFEEDPHMRSLRARVGEANADIEVAFASVAEPREVAASFGPYWALRGRISRARGDASTAAASFDECFSQDPLSVECACEGADEGAKPTETGRIPVCDAARARHEPVVGGD